MYLLYDPLTLRNAREGQTDVPARRYSVNVPGRASSHRLRFVLLEKKERNR